MALPANRQPAPLPPKRSAAKPIAITLVCGFLLALGSCFGFLNTFHFNGPSNSVSTLFVIGFATGLVLFLSACVRAVVAMFMYLFKANKEK